MRLKISFLLPAVILLLFAENLSKIQKNANEILPAPDKTVDLSGQRLDSIPSSEKEKILQCEWLILDNNNLTELPEWINEAKKIRSISIDNNPFFNFFEFCVKFQGMKTLEYFSASGCNIKEIPYQFTFFDNLNSIDFSNNLMDEIPYHLSFLTRIKEADFSDNRIKTTGYVFSYWLLLTDLNLKGNPHLQLETLGECLVNKEMKSLHIPFNGDSIPESLRFVTAGELYITGSVPDNIPEFVREWKVNSLVVDASENKFNPLKLVEKIVSSGNVKNLSCFGFQWKEVPDFITSANNLKQLDLTGNGLIAVEDLKKNKNLEKLVLNGNEIEYTKIEDLKKELPHCLIYAEDSKCAKNQDWSITPPVKEMEVKVENFIFNPKVENKIKTQTTTIEIPANAFVDEKGKVITAPVDVKFREFNDPISIAFSGIPMQAPTENGNLSNFSSAGMIEFIATSQGKEVYPNRDAPINVNISSTKNTGYNLYSYSVISGWQQQNQQPVVPVINARSVSNLSLYVQGGNTRLFRPDMRVVLPDTTDPRKRLAVKFDNIGLKVKKSNNEKSFYILPVFYTMLESKRPEFTLVFPENYRNYFSMYKLVYNGNNKTEDYYLLDSLSGEINKTMSKTATMVKNRALFRKNRIRQYRYTEKQQVHSFSLIPDPKSDDYIFSFIMDNKKYSFHVYPEPESNEVKSVQGLNKTFFQNYLFVENEMIKTKQSVSKAYQKKCDELAILHEQRKKEYMLKVEEARNGKSSEEIEVASLYQQANYSFQLSGFGIFNLDILSKMKKPEPLLAKLSSEENKPIKYQFVMLIDTKLQGVTHYTSDSDIVFDRSHNSTALIVVISNEKIGLVTQQSFADHIGKKLMPVKEFNVGEISFDQLRAMI